MSKPRKIELLSPAKNLEIGRQAIIHGADAVYIGGPQFGARSAAGNSVEDIARLTAFAHDYHAQVYVAINTILTDEELPAAESLIRALYQAEVDALIIQDMGITQLNIPPIALHASTQTDNYTPEKVKFLDRSGYFSQIVLARELSLEQIKVMGQTVKQARLEAFVHGALCVSFSGRCYISQALSGRSANRGECAQYCRLPYSLHDDSGRMLAKDRHLLSLRDLNQSDHLEALIDAGVSSLKIEGRLKEMDYVKNITAYYRQKLDQLFNRRSDLCAASDGHVETYFTPNPSKSFNREFTNYYLFDRSSKHEVTSMDTPKSKGEFVGLVKSVDRNSIRVSGLVPLNNGDGLCYSDEAGQFTGFRVNKVEDGNRIFPNEMPRISIKTPLYRSFDHEFDKLLAKDSAKRTIGVEIRMSETPFGFSLGMTDETGCKAELTFQTEKQSAKREQREQIRSQLGKLGGTLFSAQQVLIDFSQEWFIPTSQINEWRRLLVEKLMQVRKIAHRREIRRIVPSSIPYLFERLDYTANISNQAARRFYAAHGVKEMATAFEQEPLEGVPLMFTKHCVRYSLNMCPRENKEIRSADPLHLTYKDTRLTLQFDCKRCEMKVVKEPSK